MPPAQKAPAKDGANASKMKQKSLMSFFNKAPAAGASSSSKPAAEAPTASKTASSAPVKAADASERVQTDTSSDPPEARTPKSKHASLSSIVADASYTRSSDGAESFAQTPPTSDPIDVDMLSAEEDEVKAKAKSGTKAAVSKGRHWLRGRKLTDARIYAS